MVHRQIKSTLASNGPAHGVARYQQPETVRLGIDSDRALLVSAEDIIEVDVAAVNRLPDDTALPHYSKNAPTAL